MVLGAGRSVRSAELHSRFMGWGRVSIGVIGGKGVINDGRIGAGEMSASGLFSSWSARSGD